MSEQLTERQKKHLRVSQFTYAIVAAAMSNGMNYAEGLASFQCAAALMELIQKRPQTDDVDLEALAGAIVEKALLEAEAPVN
jgi:hypothetical protein